MSIAREYMRYGFTTLRDMGCADPEFPTVDLRNALAVGLVEGPPLIVAAPIISASAGHGDLRGFYASRWDLPVSAIADDAGAIKALVRSLSFAKLHGLALEPRCCIREWCWRVLM